MTHTMTVLACVRNLSQPFDNTPEEKLKSMRSSIASAYNDIFGTEERYCDSIALRPTSENDTTTMVDFAQMWNDSLLNAVETAYTAWQNHKDRLDTLEIYKLTKATMACNNEIHPYADKTLFNMPMETDMEDTDFRFSTIMKDYVLTDIKQHPEDYLLILLYIE